MDGHGLPREVCSLGEFGFRADAARTLSTL